VVGIGVGITLGAVVGIGVGIKLGTSDSKMCGSIDGFDDGGREGTGVGGEGFDDGGREGTGVGGR